MVDEEEIIDVPGMVEYDPPSADITSTSIDLKNLRTHRSPNWDGVTGTIFTPKSWTYTLIPSNNNNEQKCGAKIVSMCYLKIE